jgi:DNA processing protein
VNSWLGAVAERVAPPGVANRWVPRGDPDYPARLVGLPHEPDGLWIRSGLPAGTLGERLWRHPTVALVGSRRPSGTGLDFTRTLAFALADAGVLVVSGLARGIDGAAHGGALLAGGPTVGVLACGVDECYPPEHARLAERMAVGAALVSEWPAATPALPWRFPRRNRLISGLADVVVLIEASAQSGTVHTVRYALEQGREVMAVPRDPVLPGSPGPNQLIQAGAPPVLGAPDILAALEAVGKPAAGRCLNLARGDALTAGGSDAPLPSDAEPDRLVLTRLRTGRALTAAELANALPMLGATDLMTALIALELAGHVRRDARGRYRARGG